MQYCITESYYPKEEKFLPWCIKEYRIAHQNFSFEEPIVVGHNLVQRKYECVLCPQWGTNGVFPSPACKRFYSGMNNNSSKVCKKGPKQVLVSFSSFPIDLVLPIEFFFCFILVEGFKVSYFALWYLRYIPLRCGILVDARQMHLSIIHITLIWLNRIRSQKMIKLRLTYFLI